MRRISDHSPLIMTIWGHSLAPPTPTHFFDLSLLKEKESRATLLTAWEVTEPPPSHNLEWSRWLGAAIERVLRCSTRLTKEKRKAKGTHFRVLQQKNPPGGNPITEYPGERTGQEHPLESSRPHGRRLARPGSLKPATLCLILVQIWRHLL
jgi:hypothetical protein